MFGLGAGEKNPKLHQADYDFPEKLIEIGSTLFMEIARLLVYEPGVDNGFIKKE